MPKQTRAKKQTYRGHYGRKPARAAAELQPVAYSTGSMDLIGKTIAVPRIHRPLRYPQKLTPVKTSVLSTLVRTQYSVSAGTTVRGMLVRSPTFPLWMERIPFTGDGSIYLEQTVVVGSASTGIPSIMFDQDDWGVLKSAGSGGAGTMLTSGLYPRGVHDDGTYSLLYHGGGMEVCVQFPYGATLTTPTVVLNFEIYDGHSWDHYGRSVTGDTGTECVYNFTDFPPGFFRLISFSVSGLTANSAQTVRIGITTGGSLTTTTGVPTIGFWPLAAPPEYYNSIIPYGETRQTASAVCFTNVTAEYNKNGTVVASRVPCSVFRTPGTISPYGDWKTSSFFTTTRGDEAYENEMHKGFYTYTLPDEESETFRAYAAEVGSVPVYYPSAHRYYNLFTMTAIEYDSNFAVQIDSHLEFITSSALFPTGLTLMNLEKYKVALTALTSSGVFFENPVHMAALAGLIRSAVTALAPVVMPHVKKAAIGVGNFLLQKAVNKANQALANSRAEKKETRKKNGKK